MLLLWEGLLNVAYKQAYVASGVAWPDAGPFTGQVNGLCGATTPGSLFLVTGLHTGEVGLRAELHDAAPDVGGEWEEVVEVSFRPASPGCALVTWYGDTHPFVLPQEWLRARYCGRGMDAASLAEMLPYEGAPPIDSYALQFWPAPEPEADTVLRQTSETAAYWHRNWGGAA